MKRILTFVLAVALLLPLAHAATYRFYSDQLDIEALSSVSVLSQTAGTPICSASPPTELKITSHGTAVLPKVMYARSETAFAASTQISGVQSVKILSTASIATSAIPAAVAAKFNESRKYISEKIFSGTKLVADTSLYAVEVKTTSAAASKSASFGSDYWGAVLTVGPTYCNGQYVRVSKESADTYKITFLDGVYPGVAALKGDLESLLKSRSGTVLDYDAYAGVSELVLKPLFYSLNSQTDAVTPVAQFGRELTAAEVLSMLCSGNGIGTPVSVSIGSKNYNVFLKPVTVKYLASSAGSSSNTGSSKSTQDLIKEMPVPSEGTPKLVTAAGTTYKVASLDSVDVTGKPTSCSGSRCKFGSAVAVLSAGDELGTYEFSVKLSGVKEMKFPDKTYADPQYFSSSEPAYIQADGGVFEITTTMPKVFEKTLSEYLHAGPLSTTDCLQYAQLSKANGVDSVKFGKSAWVFGVDPRFIAVNVWKASGKLPDGYLVSEMRGKFSSMLTGDGLKKAFCEGSIDFVPTYIKYLEGKSDEPSFSSVSLDGNILKISFNNLGASTGKIILHLKYVPPQLSDAAKSALLFVSAYDDSKARPCLDTFKSNGIISDKLAETVTGYFGYYTNTVAGTKPTSPSCTSTVVRYLNSVRDALDVYQELPSGATISDERSGSKSQLSVNLAAKPTLITVSGGSKKAQLSSGVFASDWNLRKPGLYMLTAEIGGITIGPRYVLIQSISPQFDNVLADLLEGGQNVVSLPDDLRLAVPYLVHTPAWTAQVACDGKVGSVTVTGKPSAEQFIVRVCDKYLSDPIESAGYNQFLTRDANAERGSMIEYCPGMVWDGVSCLCGTTPDCALLAYVQSAPKAST
ncbi:MAG: hypothetical protein V1881_02605 [Candidatus Micrarchaeota archaeon]